MSNLKDQKAVEENQSQIYNFRMTLTSPNLKLLERVCTDFIKSAHDKKIPVTGPVRLPTRTLRITTRKTPCGEGSKTWDRYQMRIYKRIIDLKNTSSDIVRQVTSIGIYTNVDCVVTISS